MTCPSPTVSRIRATCSSMMPAEVQLGVMPAMSCRNRSSIRWPCSRVHHLGVELHPGPAVGHILERGHRRPLAARGHGEPGRGHGDAVAVAHPDGPPALLEQRAGGEHGQLGRPELTLPGVGDLTTEGLGHRLEAVADAEHRHPGREQRGVDLGRPRVVHARRAAGQHDRGRVAGQHVGDRQGVRHDLGVDLRLPHPAGDELGVLGSEVHHQNGLPLTHAPQPTELRPELRVRRDRRAPIPCRGPRQTARPGCRPPRRASSPAWSGSPTVRDSCRTVTRCRIRAAAG